MNILADENIARSIMERLQKDGHQIRHIGKIAWGSADSEVLQIAIRDKALLLTEDKDFGELVIRYQSQETGVLLVRLEDFPPIERARIIAEIVKEHGERLLYAFTVITPGLVRIRPYK